MRPFIPSPWEKVGVRPLLSNKLLATLDVDTALLGLEYATTLEVIDCTVILTVNLNVVNYGCTVLVLLADNTCTNGERCCRLDVVLFFENIKCHHHTEWVEAVTVELIPYTIGINSHVAF